MITHLELGPDFVSLYFSSAKDMNETAEKLWDFLKRNKFEHLHLQRKEFTHLPGDVPKFHPDGCPKERYGSNYRHFHILLPDMVLLNKYIGKELPCRIINVI